MRKKLILKPNDIKPSSETMSVLGVFNPGIIKYNEETIMILRVSETIVQDDEHHYIVPLLNEMNEICHHKISRTDKRYNFSDSRVIVNHERSFLTSISHFRIGRSIDGVNFEFRDEDRVYPETIYEEYGIEDPRITQVEDNYYITYSAISSTGINVRLMVTKDFKIFKRLGNILHADNKDCVIFPEKINGKYYSLHRPSLSHFGKLDIWTAQSDNLVEWGNHEILSKAKVDYSNSFRVGAGAVPFLTDEGWIEIYHTADEHNNYHLVAMLLDKENPNKVLKRSYKPLIEPTESYEKTGFMNNVVFTCGLLLDEDNLKIYYGACDERVVLCEMKLSELMENMKDVGLDEKI